MFDQAIPKMESLVRIFKEMLGGENNERVLNCYNQLSPMYSAKFMYNDALRTTQSRISIYKALNGNNV
jgi:hypothetical protein